MYLMARPTFAINEQRDKFWYGINDEVSMGEYGKKSGANG